MREVIVDGVRYIPDPRKQSFRMYLIVRPDGRAPDVYAVRQDLGHLPELEQFEISRDTTGNLVVRDITHAP